MYGRAYKIFLSRGRSTPAMRAMSCYPCRCLCLGLRLQMTRMTPRRLITLQCSQIGLTLVRTFKRRTPQLAQHPLLAGLSKPQKDRLAAFVAGAGDHVAPVQFRVPAPRLHFPDGADAQPPLGPGAQVAAQELDGLRPVDRR